MAPKASINADNIPNHAEFKQSDLNADHSYILLENLNVKDGIERVLQALNYLRVMPVNQFHQHARPEPSTHTDEAFHNIALEFAGKCSCKPMLLDGRDVLITGDHELESLFAKRYGPEITATCMSAAQVKEVFDRRNFSKGLPLIDDKAHVMELTYETGRGLTYEGLKEAVRQYIRDYGHSSEDGSEPNKEALFFTEDVTMLASPDQEAVFLVIDGVNPVSTILDIMECHNAISGQEISGAELKNQFLMERVGQGEKPALKPL